MILCGDPKSQQSSHNSNWWNGIYLLAAVGLCIRIVSALISDNIYHPDELFQYLEQAHRLVFGYGYVPWEYRFGTRSWITPAFIAIWLLLCKVLHLDNPSIYIPFVKIVFCLLSISLIFSTYIIGKNLASEKSGRLAGFFSCFWYELIYFAHKPLTDVLSTYFFVGALAYAVGKVDHRKPIVFGLLSAFCIVIRPHHLAVVAFLILIVIFVWKTYELLKAGFAFLLIIGFAGYMDFLMWGRFYISYYNSYLFNHIYGTSNFFGTEPFVWYFLALMVTSAGIFGICGLLSFIKLCKVWLPSSCMFVILLVYSLIPHKEYRFIFVVIPLLLIIGAILVTEIALHHVHASTQTFFYFAILLGFICLSMTALFYKLPYMRIAYPIIPLHVQMDHLKVYRFLAGELDLVGILDASKPGMSTPWVVTGGYYYLHRDIPIYFPQHLKSGPNRMDDLTNYVSHVICPATMEEMPGFVPIAKIGRLEIRKQINPPPQFQKLDLYSREMSFNRVDDKYIPTVRRRF